MEVFVGTSGWSYGWNEGGNLDWYLNNSSLNAVELNASFYRFPFKNQIAGWSKKGRELRWSIKVHRFVSHQYKFNDTARETWQRFLDLFAPLDPVTDYYLFQAPPSMKDSDRLISFFTGLSRLEKCVLEIRNPGLLLNDSVCRKLQECVPLVSVDSPDTKNRIFSDSLIYLRMHGRNDWYRHDYMQEELEETAALIRRSGAKKAYIFFNNDHSMLENAQRMRELLVRSEALT
jgi:uncharacterized protein YecE (DUF72 family)